MPLIKSIIFVYIRMLFVMLLSFITSSYVFKNLGVNDYGIYSVVGGVVVILAFLNNAMVATTQRYLSFNLKDQNKIIEIFRISKTIHLFVALIVFIVAETFGLYFVNHFLNFDSSRIEAVNLVYQFSLFSMIIMILNVPYMSIILVHQKMSFYALVGVIDAVLKFGLAYLLFFIEQDKLSFYAAIIFIISIFTYSFYYFYALKNFSYIKNTQYIFSFKKMKEMINFASWNLLGVFAGLGQNVGVNVLLNIYFKPEINSSRALSLQIYNAINNVNSNAQTVYTPLIITKLSQKKQDTNEYVYFFSKLGFFLICFMLVPVYFYLDTLLKFWIDLIPEYLEVFLKIMFIELLLLSLSGPLHSLLQGDGNIKWYQIIVSGLLLFNIPIGWILYEKKFDPDAIYYVSLFLTLAALIFRIVLLNQRKLINLSQYIVKVFSPVITLVVIFFVINNIVNNILLKVVVLDFIVLLFLVFSFMHVVNISEIFSKIRRGK